MKSKKKSPIDRLDEVDVYVDPRPLTKEEEVLISEYIRKQKTKTQATRRRKKRAA